MEFRELKDFVAVADAGHFHEAARKNHVAQSSLSKAIQRLEVEVGETLFLRLRSRVILTPAGEIFYQRANRIVHDVETLKRDLKEKQAASRKTVNIGVLPSIAPHFLAPLISQFAETHPALELTIHECLMAELLQMVECYEIDFAVVSLPVKSDAIEIQILFTEELLLAVPPKHPLINKSKILPNDLKKERLILMKEGCALSQLTLSFCRKNKIRPKNILRGSQMETVQSWVASGLGIAFVPQIAKLTAPTSPVYLSLDKLKPTRSIAAIWKKGRQFTHAVRECLTHLEQTAKSHQGG